MMAKALAAALTFAAFVGGCASTPDVSIRYAFPRAQVKFVVTQTLGCTVAKRAGPERRIVVATDVVSTLAYGANPAESRGSIAFRAFGGSFADADLAINRTPDHRLSGINATATGEGDTILKNAATLVGALAPFLASETRTGVLPSLSPQWKPDVTKDCAAIERFGSKKDKDSPAVVTLTYTVNVLFQETKGDVVVYADTVSSPAYDGKASGALDIQPDLNSRAAYAAIPDLDHLKMVLSVDGRGDVEPSADKPLWAGHPDWPDEKTPITESGVFPLKLNRVVTTKFCIRGPNDDLTDTATMWSGAVPIPAKSYYPLPVPTGSLFGKEGFALTLNDDGSVAKLEYSTNVGAGDVLDAAGSIAKAVPTPATQASADQAQADKIAQQQRLVKCRADPTTCATK